VNRQDALGSSSILIGDGTYSLKLEQYNDTHAVGFSQVGVKDSAFGYIADANTWVHLAFVGTSTNVSLYADGVLVGLLGASNFPLPRTYIGAGYASSGFGDFMLGSLDDILIYHRALSRTEINSIYAAGTASLVRVPLITSIQQTNGQFSLNLEGLTGKTFTISASTNLMTWTNVTTLPNPNGTNFFTQPIPTNSPAALFYRVTQP
jgi:hypothetical protein